MERVQVSSSILPISALLTLFRPDLVAAAKAEPGNVAVRAEFTKVEDLISAEAKKASSWSLARVHDILTGDLIIGKVHARNSHLCPGATYPFRHTLPTTRAH